MSCPQPCKQILVPTRRDGGRLRVCRKPWDLLRRKLAAPLQFSALALGVGDKRCREFQIESLLPP